MTTEGAAVTQPADMAPEIAQQVSAFRWVVDLCNNWNRVQGCESVSQGSLYAGKCVCTYDL